MKFQASGSCWSSVESAAACGAANRAGGSLALRRWVPSGAGILFYCIHSSARVNRCETAQMRFWVCGFSAIGRLKRANRPLRCSFDSGEDEAVSRRGAETQRDENVLHGFSCPPLLCVSARVLVCVTFAFVSGRTAHLSPIREPTRRNSANCVAPSVPGLLKIEK